MTDHIDTADGAPATWERAPTGKVLPDSEGDLDTQAYLISRGVRAVALVGDVIYDTPADLVTAYAELERHAAPLTNGSEEVTPLPFVIQRRRGDSQGVATAGYAAAQWVIDLLTWLDTGDDIPTEHRNQILGLLCGYSLAAITKFDRDRHPRSWLPRVPSRDR